jgi:hypothetical protein
MLNDLTPELLGLVCSFLRDGGIVSATAVAKTLFVPYVKNLSIDCSEGQYACECIGEPVARMLVRFQGSVNSISVGANSTCGSIQFQEQDIHQHVDGGS